VGRVVAIPHATVRIRGYPISPGTDLRSGDTVKTGDNGQARFCVKKKGMSCIEQHKTTVRVQPKKLFMLKFGGGDTTCNTTKLKPKARFLTKSGAKIDVTDPLFVVSVRKGATVVKVVSGIARLTSAGETVVVGPSQQSTAPKNRPPAAPERIDPTPQEAKDSAKLQPQIPPPNYARPPSSGSQTLSRIATRGVIVAPFDAYTSANYPSQREVSVFVTRYFGFLAKHWGVKPSTDGLDPQTAAQKLCSGGIDVYVTPDPEAVGAGIWKLPFLVDPAGIVWYLVATDDNAFRLALRGFLIKTLQSGDYSNVFKTVFKDLPNYVIFDPLLQGPGKSVSGLCPR